jgi:hypothetical protein
MTLPLLTDAQLAGIRSYGERGMTVDVTFTRMMPYAADPDNPFGDGDIAYEPTSFTVKGWIINVMHRELEEDANRIVAIHDVTLRVPVGSDIETRDLATIGGVQYTVMETNNEDTWAEWTTCYLKRIS